MPGGPEGQAEVRHKVDLLSSPPPQGKRWRAIESTTRDSSCPTLKRGFGSGGSEKVCLADPWLGSALGLIGPRAHQFLKVPPGRRYEDCYVVHRCHLQQSLRTDGRPTLGCAIGPGGERPADLQPEGRRAGPEGKLRYDTKSTSSAHPPPIGPPPRRGVRNPQRPMHLHQRPAA